jgi:hypothetical protein
MIEGRRRPGFMEQQVACSLVFEQAIAHDLDRNFTLEDSVVGRINHTHSACPELPLDSIVAKGLACAWRGVHHCVAS